MSTHIHIDKCTIFILTTKLNRPKRASKVYQTNCTPQMCWEAESTGVPWGCRIRLRSSTILNRDAGQAAKASFPG